MPGSIHNPTGMRIFIPGSFRPFLPFFPPSLSSLHSHSLAFIPLIYFLSFSLPFVFLAFVFHLIRVSVFAKFRFTFLSFFSFPFVLSCLRPSIHFCHKLNPTRVSSLFPSFSFFSLSFFPLHFLFFLATTIRNCDYF